MKNKMEQLRKLVIQGCHPGKTWDEALDAEIEWGCRVELSNLGIDYTEEKYNLLKDRGYIYTIISSDEDEGEMSGYPETIPYHSRWAKVIATSYKKYTYPDEILDIHFDDINDWHDNVEILGLPITLDRAAVIVEDKHYLIDNWKLGKDGQAGTLEEQSPELLQWMLDSQSPS